MDPLSNKILADAEVSAEHVLMEEAETKPLSLPHRAELWSGRFAMVGFMTTVVAIAFK